MTKKNKKKGENQSFYDFFHRQKPLYWYKKVTDANYISGCQIWNTDVNLGRGRQITTDRQIVDSDGLSIGGCERLMAKEDGICAVNNKEDGICAVNGKEDGICAVNGKEDSICPVNGIHAVNGKKDGISAVNGKEDDICAATGKEDGTVPQMAKNMAYEC